MSVLVKGMEMPEDGDYVFSFASDEKGRNTLLRIVKYPSFELIEHGGVVELPPHGRLIDADAIEYTVSGNGCQDDYVCRYDINEMSTIIEAEVEE